MALNGLVEVVIGKYWKVLEDKPPLVAKYEYAE
jgi:hypothetical protein